MGIKYNKKSLKKINEVDKLDDYIKIISVSSWVVLASIVFVFLCLIVWCFLGEVEGTTIFDALFGQL